MTVTPYTQHVSDHLVTGREGERVACAYLKQRRYRIVDTNVETRCGEIDLIAKDGETIVFVEVKSRAHSDAFQPSDRVNWQKIRRLTRAAHAWIDRAQERGHGETRARIDVIGVCNGEVVEHHEDVTA